MKDIYKKTFLLIFISLLNISNLFSQSQFDTLFVREVGNGVHHIYVEEKNIPWTLNILKINLNSPDIKIESVMANDVIAGLERTSAMSARYDKDSHFVIGGINADFFNYNGTPVGMQIREGEIITPPNNWSAIGFDNAYLPFIEKLSLQSNLIIKNGERIINGINKSRDTDQLILYNSYFDNSTNTNIYGSEVTIQPLDRWLGNDSTQCIVTGKISDQGNSAIPKGSAVLSGHGAAKTFINENLNIGDTVIVFHKVENAPNKIMTIVNGYPKIVSDGINCALDCFAEEGGSNSFATDRHPRTAAGISENGNYLYFVTVDGRQETSKGMALSELADFMVGIGVYSGVNLDGGGSTTMVVRGEVVNAPSDAGGERSVANALAVISTAPKGELAQVRLNTEFAKVFSDSSYKFSIGGFDENFNSIPIISSNVIYSVTNNIGEITSDGIFTAGLESDTGFVVADYEGLIDSALVVINSIVQLIISPSSSVTDTSTSFQFKVKSFDLNGYEIDLENNMFQWSSTNENVGIVDSIGFFFGLNSGETQVIVKWRNVSDTANIKIEMGAGIELLDSFESLGKWRLTGENIDTSISNIQLSTESSTIGSSSLTLNYNFIYQNGITNWAYLYNDFSIFGIPENISLDVKTNEFNHTFALIVTNYNGDEFALLMENNSESQNQFDTLYATFDNPISLTENSMFYFPLTIKNIALVLGSGRVDGTTYEGSIYFDNLRLVYPDAIVSIVDYKVLPTDFKLFQNYPNPFNPTTTINYSIPSVMGNGHVHSTTNVVLKIYDILGCEVATLVNKQQKTGNYTVRFDASNLTNGVYFYRLRSGTFAQSRKMIVLK